MGVNETTQNIHIMRNGPRIATSTINGGKRKTRRHLWRRERKRREKFERDDMEGKAGVLMEQRGNQQCQMLKRDWVDKGWKCPVNMAIANFTFALYGLQRVRHDLVTGQQQQKLIAELRSGVWEEESAIMQRVESTFQNLSSKGRMVHGVLKKCYRMFLPLN